MNLEKQKLKENIKEEKDKFMAEVENIINNEEKSNLFKQIVEDNFTKLIENIDNTKMERTEMGKLNKDEREVFKIQYTNKGKGKKKITETLSKNNGDYEATMKQLELDHDDHDEQYD